MSDGPVFAVMSEEELSSITVPFEEAGDRLPAVLEREGIAIVTGVCSPEECAELQELLGRDLLDVLDTSAPLDPDTPVAAALASLSVPPAEVPLAWPVGTPVGPKGFAGDHGLPHGRFAWRARLNARVRSLFGVLYGVKPEELVVGLDNMFFHPPSATPSEVTTRLWPHVDQNRWCEPEGTWPIFQSVLYVWPSTSKGASTTLLYPRSHTDVFERIMGDKTPVWLGKAGAHYVEYKKLEDKAFAEELTASFIADGRRMPVPAGAVLFWNSRTSHQGHSGGARLAAPICWEPASRRSEEVLRRKARLCVSGLPSTHWASLGHPHELVRPVPSARAPASGPDPAHSQLPLKAKIVPACVQPDKADDAHTLHLRAGHDYFVADSDLGFGEQCLDCLTSEVRGAL